MVPIPLTALPAEILVEICSHLCLHCIDPFPRSIGLYAERQKRLGLRSLSETCRTLYTIAKPILLHSIGPRNDIQAFIKLIVSRPDLASLTRQLRFDSNVGRGDVDFLENLARDLHLLRADQGSPARNDAWHLSVPIFVEEILLSLLIGLEAYASPVFIYDGADQTHPQPFMFSHLAQRTAYLSPEPALPSLRTLTIASGELGQRLNLDAIGPIAVLLNAAPNLHRLRIAPSFGTESHGLDNLSETALKKLEILDFLHFPLTARDDENIYHEMEALVRLCPQLQEVNVYTEVHWDSLVGDQAFSPTQVFRILQQSSSTVRRIDIDTSDSPVSPDWESMRATLADLVNMDTLALDEQCFCHHRLQDSSAKRREDETTCLTSILPQTVRYLSVKLVKDPKAIGDILHLGLDVTAGKFPNLKRLDIVTGDYVRQSVDLLDIDRDALLGAFEGTQVGVYMRRVVHHDPPDYD